MKVSIALVYLSACLAPAAALPGVLPSTSSDVLANTGLKIPGDSPLNLCTGDHSKDIVVVDRVDLSPNPPSPGRALVIKASGTVKKTIEKGAYINVVVKLGLITLINKKLDLCEQLGNVNLQCPVQPGKLDITKSVDLPGAIPPGKYNVRADAYNANGEKMTCLSATLELKIGRATVEELK
ncbi:hypothetical protein RJ55_08056 [Drechmeria coniospora]|nr:hypothetical protein RJ55_08056 [Drechmeria coniospora]